MASQKHHLDTYITLSSMLLVSIGLLALYAASAMKGAELHNNQFYYLEKQVGAIFFGGFIYLFCRFVPFKFIERAPLPLLLLSLISLMLIFVPGAYKTVGGAARWLRIGPLTVQPSELAKIALVFFLAKNMSRDRFDASRFLSGIAPNLIVLCGFAFLLMLQPDFGTTVLLSCIWFLMIYTCGSTKTFMIGSLATSCVAAAVAIFVAPYRWKRLTSFIDPWDDFKSGGFQIIQSYLGFQNGGLLGAGLGESRQKLFFLPEAHTDFILSVIGEEMGLLGTLICCLLYFNIVHLGLKISTLHRSPYKKMLALGFTLLVGIQALFNIGVVTGSLPTKGIPLPLVSSGLSSLVIFIVVVALLSRLGQELNSNET